MINFKNTGFLIKKWKWVLLGVVSLLIRQLADYTPQWVEAAYSRGLFPIIRWLFDNSLGRLPFPMLFLFYGFVFYFILKFLIYILNKKIPLKTRLTEGGHSLLSFAGFMLFLFFWLWGYNYARIPIYDQLGIKVEKLDTISLKMELDSATVETIRAREVLNNLPVATTFDAQNFENNIRRDVSNFLIKNGFKTGGQLRGREIKPQGLLFGLGISGIYMPFIGESNIDDGLHPLEKPFAMAHEMAHGYGWTEEAVANFVAYLACIDSPDAFTRFAGHLNYFRYVASNYKRLSPETYKTFRENLPESIKNDLNAINQRQNQFKTWFDTEWLNDKYLKLQGVKEGTVSYSRVVTLVHSWRKKKS